MIARLRAARQNLCGILTGHDPALLDGDARGWWCRRCRKRRVLD